MSLVSVVYVALMAAALVAIASGITRSGRGRKWR